MTQDADFLEVWWICLKKTLPDWSSYCGKSVLPVRQDQNFIY